MNIFEPPFKIYANARKAIKLKSWISTDSLVQECGFYQIAENLRKAFAEAVEEELAILIGPRVSKTKGTKIMRLVDISLLCFLPSAAASAVPQDVTSGVVL